MIPRDVAATDLDWMLMLNRAHERELSPLDPDTLQELVKTACYARVVDPEAGFLIAFDQRASYDSPNFIWFRDRLPRFLYIDRVVIDPAMRGRGLARRLYDDLFAVAARLGHWNIVCEVNSDPPNPASEAFHDALGFSFLGEAVLADRGKQVRYLSRKL